jgi:hypothetical protein
VPEEWKYGRVQQDSIKEGTLTCLLCHWAFFSFNFRCSACSA